MFGPSWQKSQVGKHAASSDWTILQPLDFKFTSQDTLCYLTFQYIAGTAHVMMGGALVPDDMHVKVVLEAIACATQLDGLVVIEVGGRTAMHNMHMFGVNPKWTKNLRV